MDGYRDEEHSIENAVVLIHWLGGVSGEGGSIWKELSPDSGGSVPILYCLNGDLCQ